MYSVGDMVTVRSWRSLVNEFGLISGYTYFDPEALLNVDIYFNKRIGSHVCGRSFPIQRMYTKDIFDVNGWIVGTWALKAGTGS